MAIKKTALLLDQDLVADAQRLLGTREIMLIHHTDCGMLTFKDADLKAQIESETGLRPPFSLEAFADVDADEYRVCSLGLPRRQWLPLGIAGHGLLLCALCALCAGT